MVYVLVFLLGVVFGGVGVAFFCMAADMSSVRPSGEVLDMTRVRPLRDIDRELTERGL